MTLKVSRLFYNGHTQAKAFALLQGRLFQLPGVEGVAVQGLARSSHRSMAEPGVSVFVITSVPSTTALEEKIGEIVCRVNLRYGTKLKAVIANWRILDSNLRAHHTGTQIPPIRQFDN